MKEEIRKPIVTVVGHVDHGKTSILDALRGSSIQEKEAGGITQKISFTLFPSEQIMNSCPLIKKDGIKLEIPGFLFIDTPGHAAFTNIRKRGGSLSDLAILVIDINDGIKPQTAEVISILKRNKTPFIIALNKIDNITGWKKNDAGLKKSVENQPIKAKQEFEEKYMILMGSLQNHGLDSDIYYNVEDFTKKIALVPCSAKTGEGLPELILVLCGLSQKYLKNQLSLKKDAKGIILEVKKCRDSSFVESILYDGKLSKKDQIAVASLDAEPTVTKIRVLEEILPLSKNFKPREEIRASTGFRMQLVEKMDILPGMPFVIFKNNKEEIKNIFQEQISEILKTDGRGIIAKADSLGSLEALLKMLKEENINVLKAGIGNINKTDLICAKANLEINEIDAIIVGFNVSIDEEAKEIISEKIKIIREEVIYKLIEDLVEFRNEKEKEIEKKKLMELSTLGKIEILSDYVFRNTNPAIFGVRIISGKINPGVELIDENEEKIGRIKNVHLQNKSVDIASEMEEVAISIPGTNFERKIKEKKFLYTNVSEKQFKNFRKNKDLLNSGEISILQEIASIKRRSNPNWGI